MRRAIWRWAYGLSPELVVHPLADSPALRVERDPMVPLWDSPLTLPGIHVDVRSTLFAPPPGDEQTEEQEEDEGCGKKDAHRDDEDRTCEQVASNPVGDRGHDGTDTPWRGCRMDRVRYVILWCRRRCGGRW